MMQLPSFVGLETLEAVARHASFSRAARELHVSQGAVSHRIRALEEELGLPLLRRFARRVELTEAGRILVAGTIDARGRLEAALSAVDDLRHPERITVSCSPSFAIRWLVPHLGLLRDVAPGVELNVAAEDALRQPGRGGIDVCVRFGPGGYRNVRSECLSHEELTPVCSPLYLKHHPLPSPAALSAACLLHDDVLLDEKGHVGWREWLGAAGVAQLRGAQELHFSHSYLALDAAVAGQGVALGRSSLVRAQLRSGVLVAPFGVRVKSGLNYHLLRPLRRTDAEEPEAHRAFCRWLRESLVAEENGAEAPGSSEAS